MAAFKPEVPIAKLVHSTYDRNESQLAVYIYIYIYIIMFTRSSRTNGSVLRPFTRKCI